MNIAGLVGRIKGLFFAAIGRKSDEEERVEARNILKRIYSQIYSNAELAEKININNKKCLHLCADIRQTINEKTREPGDINTIFSGIEGNTHNRIDELSLLLQSCMERADRKLAEFFVIEEIYLENKDMKKKGYKKKLRTQLKKLKKMSYNMIRELIRNKIAEDTSSYIWIRNLRNNTLEQIEKYYK